MDTYLLKLREYSAQLSDDKLTFAHEPKSPDDNPPTKIVIERKNRKYIMTITHGGEYVDYPDTMYEPGFTGWIDQETEIITKDSLVKCILYLAQEHCYVFTTKERFGWLADLQQSNLAYSKP